MNEKIHFFYEQDKPENVKFAESLISELGQTPDHDAKIIAVIGGDGALLHALRRFPNKTICGIVPPNSNSRGFWTNKGIDTADKLINALKNSTHYPVNPLKAEITFADGSKTTRYGYNEISIQGTFKEVSGDFKKKFDLPSTDISVQSVLMNLTVLFNSESIGPNRIMGNGLIFASSLGSTAINRSYNGPSLDIRKNDIILTGLGITEPTKGFNSISNSSDTVFKVDILSSDKRPVIVTYDSFGVIANESKSPIKNVKISSATEKTVRLVITDNPGSRAYSGMMS